MTTEDPVELELEILAEYTTDDDIYNMAVNLYKEIKNSNVESVDRVRSGMAPAGSKSGDVVTISTLAVQVLPAVLPSLFGIVQAWVTNGKGRTVKFKGKGIEFEGSPEELQKLLVKLERGKKKK